MIDHTRYQSPLSWRYASAEMRSLWSEIHKRQLWRKIWIALAKAQQPYGLVSQEQIDELQAAVDQIDIERALEIEAEIHHDLMAEIKTYAEQCPTAGGILHLGATSTDIEDNADALRLCEAMDLTIKALDALLQVMADRIEETASLPIIAFTHIQPAEPTTLGYRLSSYAQDLLEDRQNLVTSRSLIRGKGFKGAVGTGAAYCDLIGSDKYEQFEQHLSDELQLPFYRVTTQTYPRKQDYQVISALAGLGASLAKIAFDLRLLQTPPIGELSEPFGQKQVGSSAMPFKRNPINAEKIDSLARSLAVLPQVAWNNAANALLERTLDDSANRRMILPESFLLADEQLRTALKIFKGLVIQREAIRRNLDSYAPFAATERVMMALVRLGGDRQLIHERLREHAQAAWREVQSGRPNPLAERLITDPEITRSLPPETIDSLMQVDAYTGIASKRAGETVTRIRSLLNNNKRS